MIFAVSEDAICVAALGIVVRVDTDEMRHVVKGVGKRLNVCKRGSEAFMEVPLLNREECSWPNLHRQGRSKSARAMSMMG